MPEDKATAETPVMEYSFRNLPLGGGASIQVYGDGLVRIKEDEFDFKKMKEMKNHRELHITPEKVQEYAERIARNGFFGFRDYYNNMRVRDGLRETFNLNHWNHSKRIVAESSSLPSKEFKHVIEEIIGEELPKSGLFDTD